MRDHHLDTTRKAHVEEVFNKITTFLLKQSLWHQRQAAICYDDKIHRGLGRWHECESKDDFCHLFKINKFISDHKDIILRQDMNSIAPVMHVAATSLETHLSEWLTIEYDYHRLLSESNKSLLDNKEYTLLCIVEPLLKELEDECFSIKKLIHRFSYTKYNQMDVCMVMKTLHKYFEHHHKPGDRINFVIS